jgi:phosphoribosylaminoimidazole (AIR) synthetase
MGIGMVMVTTPASVDPVLATLKKSGCKASVIGRIAPGNRTVQLV